MDIKTIIITQARTGSTRLPNKILKEVDGKSLLQIHIERLKRCTKISEIIVATTDNKKDEIIFNKTLDWGLSCYRGSENDVLDRFYQSVKDKNANWLVRVTSDCPLIDPKLVDQIITFAQDNNCDYCSNGLIENFPDGQDVEVFKFSALKLAWENATLKSEREHVTPYIRNNTDFNGGNLFKAMNFACEFNFSEIRMTVDEPRDFDLIQILIKKIGIDKDWLEYTNYIIDNNLTTINSAIIRNEGFIKSLKND
ncbi:cytidylyltransferase domain-containing protein [Flavobacterium psychrophilum]|uniref:cytidylyltransferase domain-containing protein n=1 Tax=Flavobacterium psychrophilum TaxID=96345 RepID=UPI001D07CFD8|nr:glycosyltransferase family protein [Flavobacterium psychrophilum]EKT3956840.1 glycosyltransferase family protein [Flavobacterium psychrophilum]EKT4508457.1 glycosyltransferase family protein [Flavobacterium psychrophilum]MCB6088578.1 glycosyltransferase family protein [Flavobacterium psychrophilum]